MKRDWELVKVIDRAEISEGVFCLAKIVDKNSGCNAYLVTDNGEKTGIFTELKDAKEALLQRIRIWLNAGYEWDVVKIINKVKISGSVIYLAEIVDKNSGLKAYIVYDNGKSYGISTELHAAEKIFQKRISFRRQEA